MNPLVELLLGTGRAHPSNIALIIPGGDSWTFQDLERVSGQLAHALIHRGLAPGDRVLVQWSNCAELIALNLAVARIGAVYVPANETYTEVEILEIVKDAKPTLIIRKLESELEAHSTTLNILLGEAKLYDSFFQDVDRELSDLATILYTSGTTGKSKGAMLSHENLVFNARNLIEYWEFSHKDVLLHALPLFHIHGLFVAMHCAIASGASLILLEKFDPIEVIRHLPNASVYMGVPTHYSRLLSERTFTSEVAKGVRVFISGSAPMTIATHLEFENRSGQRILERYGMTETCMITSNPYKGERKVGTVGKALPGVSLRVVNGSPGDIEVKGPNVFAGYWNRPDLISSEFTQDGWFKTGDVGTIDQDGYLEISGRAKDLVITGGLNVYPKEIEIFLDSLPEIQESAVIGVPDSDFGEVVVAIVVLVSPKSITSEELRAACRKNLAGFKIPKRFEIVDELARNSMGKVQKNVLRDMYAKAERNS